MKKKLLVYTLICVLGCLRLCAQIDVFFVSKYSEYREDYWSSEMPLLPESHGLIDDYQAYQELPVGGGFILLAGLGLIYASIKRHD